MVHETVQNVLSSVDIETVAINETNTPTQRYKLDSAWFNLYPWLKKDEECSKIEDSDFYYCECCRAFGDSAHGGYASQWVCGWGGGFDGFRRTTINMHSKSAIHTLWLQRFNEQRNCTELQAKETRQTPLLAGVQQ